MRAAVIFVPLVFAGCFESPTDNDVVGPFTGASHRFVVDGFALPVSTMNARLFGGDLDGDGVVDNAAGQVIGTMAGQDDITEHTADMIAAGSVASHLEILADNLASDDHVGVLYFGADGDDPIAAGGRFDDLGVFVSNRTRDSHHPGAAHVRIPVFREADPLDIEIEAMEVDLVPDGTGYVATIHGAIRGAAAASAAADGILQMVANHPGDHLNMWSIFDTTPQDGVITKQEVLDNPLFLSLMSPDLSVFGSRADALSIGFQAHLRPALSGDPPADACFDREQDGDETDVDCGGSCGACTGGQTCSSATDCETGGCGDGGTCLPASCADGVKDGFETDVDCGGSCAVTDNKRCVNGQTCKFSDDCALHSQCDVGTGTCVPGV